MTQSEHVLGLLNGMNARRANEAEDYALALRGALRNLMYAVRPSAGPCPCGEHDSDKEHVVDWLDRARSLLPPSEPSADEAIPSTSSTSRAAARANNSSSPSPHPDSARGTVRP